jgi:uncharacterized membrane protein YgcG
MTKATSIAGAGAVLLTWALLGQGNPGIAKAQDDLVPDWAPPAEASAGQVEGLPPYPEFPEPLEEPQPDEATLAESEYAWLPGHWIWTGEQYEWQEGMWVYDLPGFELVLPHGEWDGEKWVFHGAGWMLPDGDEIVYRPTPVEEEQGAGFVEVYTPPASPTYWYVATVFVPPLILYPPWHPYYAYYYVHRHPAYIGYVPLWNSPRYRFYRYPQNVRLHAGYRPPSYVPPRRRPPAYRSPPRNAPRPTVGRPAPRPAMGRPAPRPAVGRPAPRPGGVRPAPGRRPTTSIAPAPRPAPRPGVGARPGPRPNVRPGPGRPTVRTGPPTSRPAPRPSPGHARPAPPTSNARSAPPPSSSRVRPAPGVSRPASPSRPSGPSGGGSFRGGGGGGSFRGGGGGGGGRPAPRGR